jgi:uncharacterized protein (DUF736 family)
MDNSTSNNTSNNSARKNDEVGALWKRKSKSGMTYLAGHVKYDELGKEVTSKVVVFSNDNKSNDKQPDYRIYLSKPLGAATVAATQQQPSNAEESQEDLM